MGTYRLDFVMYVIGSCHGMDEKPTSWNTGQGLEQGGFRPRSTVASSGFAGPLSKPVALVTHDTTSSTDISSEQGSVHPDGLPNPPRVMFPVTGEMFRLGFFQ